MTEEEAKSDKARLFNKISAFRAEINAADWSPDKSNVMQNYRYVSEAKFKAIISPALVHNGLECKIEYGGLNKHDPIGKMSQHYTVLAEMRLIDIDTGEYMTYQTYGEAADSGDKGLAKALTSAYKSLFANNFMVSAYEAENDTAPRIFSTAAEKEEARKVISDHVFTPKPKAEPVKAPAAPVKAAEPVKQATTPAPAAKPVKAPAGPQAPASPILLKAAERMMNSLKATDPADLIRFGGLDAVEIEYNEALSQGADSVKAFYTKYKQIGA